MVYWTQTQTWSSHDDVDRLLGRGGEETPLLVLRHASHHGDHLHFALGGARLDDVKNGYMSR